MIITDGEKTMTLQELGWRICNMYNHGFRCNACPAAAHCSDGHNGIMDWLRKVIDDEHLECVNYDDYEARRVVYARANMQYGSQLQAVVALEELSEAQKEICKFLRGKGDIEHLAEEVADAFIVLEQIRMIYGIKESVSRYMDAKVQRLADRLKERN